MSKRQPLTKNQLTPVEEKEILQAAKEAREGKNVTKPMGAREAIDYLTRSK